jgi:transcriptional regulator with XRE-family HTH domain
MSNKEKETVGSRIRALRKKKDMLQRQISKQIGVSKTNYCNWECDLYLPSSKNIVILAKFHQVSPAYILSGSNKK